ncbi:uncharacterized protein TRIVIDRAFT_79446 [Trichoderma virens Gv29-8]|uniref:Uncharacterized protein n=1 Tax=Hypocrea virens (strain Gv29-8 / FGSC 10586) TaxID=413071 RepID=G9MEQ8_HYPVG|nr:uncharacterized protein TRIVIDRAFT_79446 [Trichoderma virens Gv29-8]EHK26876.1 hypothetical protein TRIVIDRAFT_79446 [Trichoderma virens Gv29-8]UKZ57330.1 hypothetical protein TrVGV298_011183 [Trichoderma virens]
MSNSGLPLDATITIVNNSGKIISTGKQLLSIWKTAQASYREKKDELSQERAQERAADKKPPPVPIKRAQTFDTSRSIPHRQYDELSVASSHRTFKSSIAKKQLPPVPNQLALTEGNLEKLSEVSSVAPSKPPSSYQGSYADTMLVKSGFSRVDPPMALQQVQPRPLARTRSDMEVEAHKRMSMGSDLHLAYGDIPPDLADRVDLDAHTTPHVDLHDIHVEDEREQAEELIHKIENLLDEAHCAQHSATAIITHLQERPDAAAAVALTLAELSGIITKLSPGFAAILKGTSPAIFALLASPQFLIGTGIAVGVTVVMFGGWKIVQRATQNSFAKKAMAYEAAAAPAPAPNLPQIESGVDEAIVLETVEVDLSSIDSWRRGIVVDPGYESADQELMTPLADRVTRERRGSKAGSEDYFSRKSSKSHRSSKTHSSSHSSSHKSHKSRHEKDSSDRKSSSSSSSKKSDDTSSVSSMALIKKSIASRKKQIDETGIKSEELPLRNKMKQTNMLKALFKGKEHRQSVAT